MAEWELFPPSYYNYYCCEKKMATKKKKEREKERNKERERERERERVN